MAIAPSAVGAIESLDVEGETPPETARCLDEAATSASEEASRPWEVVSRQRVVRYGHIRAVRLGGCLGVVWIGPHWYCSVLMLLIILGVGFIFLSKAIHMGTQHVIAGLAVTFCSAYTFLRCALVDPGILSKPYVPVSSGCCYSGRAQYIPSTGNRLCETCNLTQPRGTVHCEWCEVCIDVFDHHCPWMNKCIGKKNVGAFYRFLCVSFSSLAYIVLTVMLVSEVLV